MAESVTAATQPAPPAPAEGVLRAVLFDLDGTLADTESGGHRPAYNEAFKDLGLPWRWGPALYKRLLGQPSGEQRVRHYVEAYSPDDAPDNTQDLDALVQRVHSTKSDHYRKRLASGRVRLRPGVRRLIAEARASDLRVAIVTNGSLASVTAFLEHCLGQAEVQRFDLIVSSQQAPEHLRKKPAPDLYNYALEQLGVHPADAVAIEDSAGGLQAAVAAGIPTLVTTNQFTRDAADRGEYTDAALVTTGLGTPDQPARMLAGRSRFTQPGVVDVGVLRALVSAQAGGPQARP